MTVEVSQEKEPASYAIEATSVALVTKSLSEIRMLTVSPGSPAAVQVMLCVPFQCSPPSGLVKSILVTTAFAVATKKPLRRAAPKITGNIFRKPMELREACKLCISFFDKRINCRAHGLRQRYAIHTSCLVDTKYPLVSLSQSNEQYMRIDKQLPCTFNSKRICFARLVICRSRGR